MNGTVDADSDEQGHGYYVIKVQLKSERLKQGEGECKAAEGSQGSPKRRR